ncbi:hypothetical protein N0V93_008277 [Gnomoniopsis smithogilvyi]|uniref:Microbial-type PARG catalytic domain-containing protein n=1 Tax=Gnomoniopsis smithogilvyi TaxID=1191159 RepID=A0A9W9CUQ8_9PEZI|nr:hypothetical protein N0V93_008277 [Gnomoniopsis smithogilvyi]
MSPSSSSRSSKPKPAEVAAETKKFLKKTAGTWPAYSYLFSQPLAITQDQLPPRPMLNLNPPSFYVRDGDPVDFAACWSNANNNAPVAFICAANEKRPGGDWETGVSGYEERLCRRSNLSSHLSTPKTNYPLPAEGGLYSGRVVVFRGPHDRYEHRDPTEWHTLPVVSVVPTRWPKLKSNGTCYSFEGEYELAKAKLRAALTICVYNDIRTVVIGDFGLGGGRNPPQAMAEMWREVLLWDPNLRGRIENVAFVFEDRNQSTMRLIMEELARKSRSGGSSGSGGSSSSSSKGKGKPSSSSTASYPTDYQIFAHVFGDAEVTRVLTQPDSRMGVNNIVS